LPEAVKDLDRLLITAATGEDTNKGRNRTQIIVWRERSFFQAFLQNFFQVFLSFLVAGTGSEMNGKNQLQSNLFLRVLFKVARQAEFTNGEGNVMLHFRRLGAALINRACLFPAPASLQVKGQCGGFARTCCIAQPVGGQLMPSFEEYGVAMFVQKM